MSHKVAKGPFLEPNLQLQVLPLLLTGWVTVGKPGNSSVLVCPVGIIVALHPILKYNDPTHTVLLPAFFRLIKRVNGFHVIKHPSIKCLRATRHLITQLCHKAFWSLQPGTLTIANLFAIPTGHLHKETRNGWEAGVPNLSDDNTTYTKTRPLA